MHVFYAGLVEDYRMPGHLAGYELSVLSWADEACMEIVLAGLQHAQHPRTAHMHDAGAHH